MKAPKNHTEVYGKRKGSVTVLNRPNPSMERARGAAKNPTFGLMALAGNGFVLVAAWKTKPPPKNAWAKCCSVRLCLKLGANRKDMAKF